MNASRFKPVVAREPDGRIAVYVGAAYQYLSHEAALSMFQQMAGALRIPYSEGVARYAARMLAASRTDGGSSIDGGDAQDHALESELLELFDCPRGGCGDDCYCSEGDKCLRPSQLGRELLQFIEAEPEPLREVGR